MNNKSFERFTKKAGALGMLGVVILKDGEKAAERHFEEDHRRNLYSGSKSFTSLAVGIAQKEGLLDPDERIVDIFPDKTPQRPSEELLKLTVRDALSMRMGQENAWLMGADRPKMQETDWISFILSRPFTAMPGSVFLYNNAGTYLAGCAVQKRCGCSLTDYLMPRFLEPAGIRMRPTWETDPNGWTFGAGGLMLTVNEFAKWGQLFAQRGEINGKRVLTEAYIADASGAQISTDKEANADWKCGYCMGMWRGTHHSYRADGKYGQLCVVLEDKNAVICMASHTERTQELLDAVWEEIEPCL